MAVQLQMRLARWCEEEDVTNNDEVRALHTMHCTAAYDIRYLISPPIMYVCMWTTTQEDVQCRVAEYLTSQRDALALALAHERDSMARLVAHTA